MKLSNCAARTRKIITIANTKVNSRLEELSAKSLDSPVSAVVKFSVNTLSATSCIAFNPSPSVFGGTGAAVIVAEESLLNLNREGDVACSFNVTKLLI